MPGSELAADGIDWSLTTWDGSRREQLRRWAALPLERVILAIEEMEELGDLFGASRDETPGQPSHSPLQIATLDETIYEDGTVPEDRTMEELVVPHARRTAKIGRNDPCHCGSGKKYKKCCLTKDRS